MLDTLAGKIHLGINKYESIIQIYLIHTHFQ